MDIIQGSRCGCDAINVQLSSSFSFRPRNRSGAVTNSIFSLKPKSSCSRYRRLSSSPSTTTTRALLEDRTSDSVATKVVEADLTLEIKKRAAELSHDLKGTSIFLVGLNSSIKSSLGQVLANALRYYYFDSDALVEDAVGGRSAAKSYLERDEEGFLASETEVLKQLSSMGRLVVCAGNGAVRDASNLALLRHGISVWVDVPLDLVASDIVEERIQLSASDIMLMPGTFSEVLGELSSLYGSRQSGYATADTTISLQKVASELGCDELEGVTAEDMCMEVIKEIEKLMRLKKMMEEAAKPF